MRIEDWLTAACADAERRGLEELRPLLDALAKSTHRLRQADTPIVLPDEDAPKKGVE